MPVRIQNALRLLGRNAEQRTEGTWARVIGCFEGLPEPYRESVSPLLVAGESFPYTVLAPAYETFRSRVSEKLVCVLEHEIHILERNGKLVTATCYPIEEIRYVEVSSMLLDYRVKIVGINGQGVSASSIFRCSTATDYLFTPILRKIRLRGSASQDTVQTRDAELFDGWSSLNYKFMNFARNSLLGGERVVCAILQPEIKAERFRILGRTFYRTISPTHTCILTERELILIREEALQDRKDKYGGIWNFIPLSKMEALSISSRNDLLALSVELHERDVLTCLFQASKESEVSQLPVRFHDLISH